MIIELDPAFIGTGEVKDFVFTLLKRNEFGYIYKIEHANVLYYEVFKRKLTPICIDFERRIYSENDFKVKYPKAKDFGKWAWTFNSLEKALDKFNTLKYDKRTRSNNSRSN